MHLSTLLIHRQQQFGSEGFVGFNLSNYIKKLGHNVFGIDFYDGRDNLKNWRKSQLNNAGVKTFKAKAKISTDKRVILSSGDVISSRNIIIATGSRPRKIDTIPFDEKVIMTSDGISSLKEFPESLVILGAGVIGCEFATIFSNLST